MAVGLEVMAELMAAEVTEVAGVRGEHDRERRAVPSPKFHDERDILASDARRASIK